MRINIPCGKKRLCHTILLFCLVAAFLAPSVHSHDHRHDDGRIHLDHRLKVTATHNHAEHQIEEWHSDNLFVSGANLIDFSRHDHNNNPHSHFLEKKSLRAKRGVGSPEQHKSFFIQAVGRSLAFNKLLCKTSNQSSSITCPSCLEFIFVATNLPPPIV